MLFLFVSLYLLLSVAVGLLAVRWVRGARDFAVAGRRLSFPVVTATVFATWFGAESIFGVSATFATEGLRGVVADPFGASLCLMVGGWFFATYLYKLNLLTLGDYFRIRYDRSVEVLLSVFIIFSYLGWVAAQIKALGLILHLLSQGMISEPWGMVIGTVVVLLYTVVGGMLSVAILDFLQMLVIVVGLSVIAWWVADSAGGASLVFTQAEQAGKFVFLPPPDVHEWLIFLGAGLTMALGSIPQQDVFQRVTSAKNQQTALWGSLFGGLFYFCFCGVSMFIAYGASLVNPTLFQELLVSDSQRILPMLVINNLPLLAQVIFFGAVLAAITSTSSATLLAPAVSFSENVLRVFLPAMNDRLLLKSMRVSIVLFAMVVLSVALTSGSTIFELVENTYKVTLAGVFAPLCLGVFWRRANSRGALLGSIGGVASWLLLDLLYPQTPVPAQLIGFVCSFLLMWLGSVVGGKADAKNSPSSLPSNLKTEK